MDREHNMIPENQDQAMEQDLQQSSEQAAKEAVPAEQHVETLPQDTVETDAQAVSEETAEPAPEQAPRPEEPAPEGAGQAPAEQLPAEQSPAEQSPAEQVAEQAPVKQAEKSFKVKSRRPIHRKWRYGSISVALTAVVVAAVVLLNLIVGILNDRYPFKFDLTKDKQFTLSKESIEIAKEIQDEVNIIVFEKESVFSNPGFGNELDTIFRQFYEACKQYNLHSGGKVKVTYLDAAANPAEAAKYEKYSPKANESVLFLSGNRSSVVDIYDFFTFDQQLFQFYGIVDNVQSLVEKTIATNIRKVAGDLQPAIIFTGHGEREAVIQEVTRVLDRNGYEVLTHDLTSSAEIDPAANVAILAAPSIDFGEEAMRKLRAWIENDGMRDHHLTVLVNRAARLPVLYEYLKEEFGIEVTNDIIVETDNSRVYANIPFQVFGDAGVVEFTENFKDKKVLSLYTRRLITHKPYDTNKGYYNAQLVTFPSSAKLINLDEGENAQIRDADEYPVVGMAFAQKEYTARSANMLVHTYVLVCGSEDFLLDAILTSIGTAENENLFMTVYNHMSTGDENVTISGRSLAKTRLTVSSAVANWVGIGLFTLGLPLITLLIGLIIYMRRRHL